MNLEERDYLVRSFGNAQMRAQDLAMTLDRVKANVLKGDSGPLTELDRIIGEAQHLERRIRMLVDQAAALPITIEVAPLEIDPNGNQDNPTAEEGS